MNEPNSPPTAPAPKTKRKRVITPRKPRAIDPGIAAINAEAAAKRKAHRDRQASARMLRVILEKRLPKLCDEDRNKLADALRNCSTPTLPGTEAMPVS